MCHTTLDTYTHSGQVRVCECVALTQLGPFLAGMWWSLCLRRFLKRHFAFDSRDRQGLWSAGEHCEAVCSCPYHLRGCALQLLIHSKKVPRACVHARTRICVRACVCLLCVARVCKHVCVCVSVCEDDKKLCLCDVVSAYVRARVRVRDDDVDVYA